MSFEQEEIMDLAVMGIGAGASGAITGYLKNMMPGVSEDILAIIAGGGLYLFGGRVHPLVQKVGAGMLIQGIGTMTKGLIPAPGGGNQNQSQTQKAPTSLKTLAQMEAMRG